MIMMMMMMMVMDIVDVSPSLSAVSGQPVPCPFQGPYSFSYTNESVESCKDPLSEIHACADKSRFIFNYKRCKRLPHTQDIREYRD